MAQRFAYDAERERLSEARAKALEALLIEKGIITSSTVDKVIGFFETEMGPFNGAKVVARAWVDPDFKERLLADANAAIDELGFPPIMSGAEGEHMRVAENTAARAQPDHLHAVLLLSVADAGAAALLVQGPTFRARAAREPRSVLKEFGLDLEPAIEIKVWDSSAQIRWFVLPERPAGPRA